LVRESTHRDKGERDAWLASSVGLSTLEVQPYSMTNNYLKCKLNCLALLVNDMVSWR